MAFLYIKNGFHLLIQLLNLSGHADGIFIKSAFVVPYFWKAEFNATAVTASLMAEWHKGNFVFSKLLFFQMLFSSCRISKS